MMSKILPILRRNALVLPVVFVAGWLGGGLHFGLGATLAGTLALLNLRFLGWLSTRYVDALGSDQDGTLWGVALSLKWMFAVPAFASVVLVTSPAAFALGFSAVLLALPFAALATETVTPLETT